MTDPTPTPTLTLAVAQTQALTDPSDAVGIADRGAQVRLLMREASRAGARLLALPEGTLCWPSKHALSSVVGEVAESDWSRFAWQAQADQHAQIAGLARRLRLWTVIGAPFRAPDATGRPFLSLLVIDDRGETVARYDERLLSRTKRSFMYAAGSAGVTLEIDGIRLGLLSGLEGLFDDVVAGYERDGADAVLYATAGPSDPGSEHSLTASAVAAARQHGLWVGYAVHADKAPDAPAGVVAPDGRWAARCPAVDESAIVVVEIGPRPEGPGRAWRREMLASFTPPRP